MILLLYAVLSKGKFFFAYIFQKCKKYKSVVPYFVIFAPLCNTCLTLSFFHFVIFELPHFLIILPHFVITKSYPTLREKCPNTEFFLVRIFPHSDWIQTDTKYLSVFSPNAGKYGPEKTPYLDTFHTLPLCYYFAPLYNYMKN